LLDNIALHQVDRFRLVAFVVDGDLERVSLALDKFDARSSRIILVREHVARALASWKRDHAAGEVGGRWFQKSIPSIREKSAQDAELFFVTHLLVSRYSVFISMWRYFHQACEIGALVAQRIRSASDRPSNVSQSDRKSTPPLTQSAISVSNLTTNWSRRSKADGLLGAFLFNPNIGNLPFVVAPRYGGCRHSAGDYVRGASGHGPS
jgi:hypothetical protein